MFDRILIPLDGSERSKRVLSQVARLLRRHDAEVVLVRSVFVPPSLARIDTAKLAEEHRKEAAEDLRKTAELLNAQGARARAVVLEGPAAEAVLDAARREKATMIALSTHGRGGVSRWLLGSVAEKVLRGSELPVLLLHSFRPDSSGAPVPVGDGQIPFRRVLVPLDGSEASRAVLPGAERFARLFESELLLLTVETDDAPGAAEDARATAERLKKEGVKAATLHLKGDPASEILDAAEAENADLIAMATHGRSGVSRWVFGSVTERVLRESTIPLLVVRSVPAGL